MVHGDTGAAERLHEILLGKRWAVALQSGTGSDDKLCVLRRPGRVDQIDSKGHSCSAKAHFVCILKAMEIEAEEAFVGA